MRFMILRKSDAMTESGGLPGAAMLEAMGRYCEELSTAGVFRGGDGLFASSRGARLHYKAGAISITDGPFAEAREVIAGFIVIEVASLDEALRWAARCPSLAGDGEAEMEVRQVVEAADFPAAVQPLVERLPWSTPATQAAAQKPGAAA